MPYGSIEDPRSPGTWYDLYNNEDEVPYSLGTGDNVGFSEPSAALEDGKSFLLYYASTQHATLRGYQLSMPMSAYPVVVSVRTGQVQRNPYRDSLMTMDGIDPIQPFFTGWEIVAMLLMIAIMVAAVCWAIVNVGGQNERKQINATIAHSMEVDPNNTFDFDVNSDGIADVRQTTWNNGTQMLTALNDIGKAHLNGEAYVKTNEGLDWNEFCAQNPEACAGSGSDQWMQYLMYAVIGGVAIGGFYMAYKLVVRKEDPFAGAQKYMAMKMMGEGAK